LIDPGSLASLEITVSIPDFSNYNNAPTQRASDETRPDFIDQEAASDALAERAADWVRQLFPNGKLDDEGHLRVANINGDRPKKSGSCIIYMHGDRAGSWHEFDGGDGGGPLSTIARRLGLGGAELFAKVRELVGVFAYRMPEGKTPAKPKADHGTEIAHILRQSSPIAGTLAAVYLAARGITIPINCPDLRFNGNTTHWETRTGMPALIAQFRYPGGSEAGIHRIYLEPDGSWHTGKKMLGPCEGAVVMLSPLAARMGVGEGIESTLAAMEIFDIPAWATGSADNMRKLGDYLALNPGCPIRQLEIFADRGKAGQDAALYLARAARSVGIDV
jgi:putative DNA primase/helicase